MLAANSISVRKGAIGKKVVVTAKITDGSKLKAKITDGSKLKAKIIVKI